MVKAKVFVFEKLFDGLPKEDDLKIVEEELPPIKNGEFLVEAIYLSVDPYMRAYTACHKIGETNVGSQVGKILESKNPGYPAGQYVVGNFGWRTHSISKATVDAFGYKPTLVPNIGNLPLSLALGVLGMPGNTAYFGFLEICTPQAGETVVVTGAAGAVGSHVGQIAKIKGCKVIGVTGSDEKGKWLVEELGFDHFINYKTADLDKALDELAPEKIDCYFDNVGGEISSIILRHMNNFGRISVCGSISGYNNKSEKATTIQRPMISLNLTMEGFIVSRWANRWNEGIQQNLKWIKEGKLKYHETVTEGFENMLKAFIELFTGGNVGKAIVKV
ncbi:prostaglandin reductase 1 isoform X1 [Anoplophora glabripennis]|uniref:Prostaglandin reductase 1 n=1 Tax=Anoplophora glabripennis TaxID=217634 RepID=V5G6N9_ANOGL|nr:prostaglandin reductase 1 isoform X1 [Anoplophora glabripennis]